MSLLQKSLKFRKRNLRAYITEVPGRLEYAAEWEGQSAQDVRQRMDEIMASRGEGLVLKHPDSEYVLNGRNRDWVKVKPEYIVCPAEAFPRRKLTDQSSRRTIWVKPWTSS